MDWDDLGDSSYTSPSKELAQLVCAKLEHVFSDGKDSILKAILDDNVDDMTKIWEAVESAMMVGAKGYLR